MQTLLATSLPAQKVLFPLLVFLVGFWNIVYGFARLDGLETPQPAAPLGVEHPASSREKVQPSVRSPALRSAHAAAKTQERGWSKHHQHGKPFLVIHVGPIHTLAPELENQLTKLSSELQSDGFVLANERTRASLTNYECHKELHETRKKFMREKSKGNLGDIPLKLYLSSNCECWGHVLQLLEHHRGKGESLIVIDGSLAGRQFHFDGLWKSTMDLISIEETLSDIWNVEIVVGYRRFAEWLPLAVESNSRQRHREMERRQLHHPMVSKDDYPITPALFPDIISSAENGVLIGVNASHTLDVVDQVSFREDGQSKIPVTVFNVYEGPLAKTFTCNILWYATKACQAAAKLPPVTLLKRKDPVQLLDFYDLMAANAYKHTAYRIHDYSTQVASIAMRYFQEDVLGLKASDLAMECPSKQSLERLLQLSLNHERDILPYFAPTHVDEHSRSFWEMANDPHRLCTVSWNLIMRQAKWRIYIRQLPHDVPKELLPHEVTHNHNETPKAIIRNGKYKGRITVKRIQHNH